MLCYLCFLNFAMPCLNHMSLAMRKPVFGGLQPGITQTDLPPSLEILDIASIDTILSKERTIKTLIKWCGCAADLR